MSDKPIHAEIVRPDQIKVGDTVLLWGQPLKILSIKAESGLIHTEYKDSDGEIHSVRFGLEGRVARILPEPVEVRDQWLVEYIENGMEFYVPASDRNHAIEVAKTINGATSILCERMSVISREEVKP